VDKGSTFRFALPFELQRTPLPESGQEARQTSALRDLPILVVDDNALSRRLLEATLRRWQMNPVIAATGRAGLAAVRERHQAGAPFALVLLDVLMPDLDGFSVAAAIRDEPALATTRILMMTSAGKPGDGARCRALGIGAYLTKPIVQAQLLEAIVAVLSMPSEGGGAVQVVTRHSLRERRRKLRILLVEDNKINQVVAARLLEKQGHVVVVAHNGKRALAVLEDAAPGGFDMILMDVQMPEMDGFEATKIIRERETASGGHLPIVAMTAHAMKGDEERCLASGMDGYLAKPIQADALFATIAALVP
jgi:CheY-like chemotaxis protein